MDTDWLFAFESDVSSIPASIPMIAITTNNSIKVKAEVLVVFIVFAWLSR
jgi:hypothetical protein